MLMMKARLVAKLVKKGHIEYIPITQWYWYRPISHNLFHISESEVSVKLYTPLNAYWNITHHTFWRALLLPVALLLLEDAWLVEATVRDLTFFLELPALVLTLVLLLELAVVALVVPLLLVADPVLWATLLLDLEPWNLVMDCSDSATYCCSNVDM